MLLMLQILLQKVTTTKISFVLLILKILKNFQRSNPENHFIYLLTKNQIIIFVNIKVINKIIGALNTLFRYVFDKVSLNLL